MITRARVVEYDNSAAALDLSASKVAGRRYNQRRRVEFLEFMNKVVADDPSTHGPKPNMRLKRHENAHFRFTPTHASWLGQVEIWFSILLGKALDDASFQSAPELVARIEAFIADYNVTAGPFVRTKSRVRQKRLKPCFAD